jgi:hypothetical protein
MVQGIFKKKKKVGQTFSLQDKRDKFYTVNILRRALANAVMNLGFHKMRGIS